jgi:hypothetical protein
MPDFLFIAQFPNRMKPPPAKTAIVQAIFCLMACSQVKAQNSLTLEGGTIHVESSAIVSILGNLENKNAGTFHNYGTVSITGHLYHNGSLSLNSLNAGTFRLSGTGNQYIAGTYAPNFYDLELNKSGGECHLQTDLTLSHNLVFNSGNLFLNDHQVDLLNSGSLINESSANRVYDLATGNGTLKVVATLHSPAAYNPGNLGAYISSSQNPGLTTITRGHAQQFIVSGNSITRYYDIQPANNTDLSASLRFTYFDSELNGQQESDLTQWYSTINNSVWVKKGGIVDSIANYVNLIGIDSFSRVSLISNKIVPLPLKLLSFTAIKFEISKALLQWKTADEINCSHFEIERSTDGRKWDKVGSIPNETQSSPVHFYQFIDPLPATGSNFYRLKQIDLDHRFEYSAIRVLKFESLVRIYPTLLRNGQALTLAGISSPDAVIEFLDNNGRLIAKPIPATNKVILPPVSPGCYHLRILNRIKKNVLVKQQIVIF